MRYWQDCEFIENGVTIDLISIGVAAQDGREFYAQNSDCNFDAASDWVKVNVFPHLKHFDLFGQRPIRLSDGSLPDPWMSHKSIGKRLREFCDVEIYGKPEWWAYFGAYDHVALCQLYGPMIDLPKGWPFYTRDLKQWADALGNPRLPLQEKDEHHALADARQNKKSWEFLFDYERQLEAKKIEGLYAPGAWRCPKCGLRLQNNILHAADGSVSASLKKPEPCNNDGAELVPVTWKDIVEDQQALIDEFLAQRNSSGRKPQRTSH
jgi:hypothetical protein